MKIELIISTDTLGDVNTAADNQRYADAVKAKIQQWYPVANVNVSLSDNPTDAVCHVTGFSDNSGESEFVADLESYVWDQAEY